MKNPCDPTELITPLNAASASSSGSEAETLFVKRAPEKRKRLTPTGLDKAANVIRPVIADDTGGLEGLLPAPKIRRISMIPRTMDRRPLRRLWQRILGRRPPIASGNKHDGGPFIGAVAALRPGESGWRSKVRSRRIVLALVVLVQTLLAVESLARTFPYPHLSHLETAILANFAILFSWISFSFWTSIAGFCVLLRGMRVKSVSRQNCPEDLAQRQPVSHTAVLVPICNEEVARVFAGIEASYRSLTGTGKIDKFDFYFLSDTSDAEKQVEEELAWARLCQDLDGFGRIFYRHRRLNIKRKSGNIADFVRRWGRNYDYMIVFDADSIMAGETMVCMANMMDLYPQVGILQTTPTIVNRESLFARLQQFASRVYGPIFNAGLRFWQGGESYYWGHNAILRVAPFIKHCGLSRLPGRSPLGGEILSHDFVEAALMGRAGWEVWIVDDLPGSFEESPPTILDELKRDRRWCQGNLQHLRLLGVDGLRFGHRSIMAMGIMAYASAFLWAIFLLLSTAEVVLESLVPPVYFSAQHSLFPVWPRWHPEIAITLLGTTAVMLFLAKFLSLLLIVLSGDAARYGGAGRMSVGIVIEIVISALLAPIRMWFHSKYVFLTLLGREIKWGSQRRDGAETSWTEALRQHGILTLVGLAWTAGLLWLNPSLAGWVLPVTVPMSLSVPLSVWSSRARLGLALRQCRLLLIPEEIRPPQVLGLLHEALRARTNAPGKPHGFVRVIREGFANAVHISFLRDKCPKLAKTRERNKYLQQKAMMEGPAQLTKPEIGQLLRDADALAALHRHVRRNPDPRGADA